MKFVSVDLAELSEAGVLMAANERFFWPLGLSLAWTLEPDGATHSLHIREWEWEPGRGERIDIASDDEVAAQRRRAFERWLEARLDNMKPDERLEARTRLHLR